MSRSRQNRRGAVVQKRQSGILMHERFLAKMGAGLAFLAGYVAAQEDHKNGIEGTAERAMVAFNEFAVKLDEPLY